MGQVTALGMDATPTTSDRWLIESLGRGAGAFVGRVTPSGARTFYFRYTDPQGRQVRLKIGDYAPNGKVGMSVKTARQVALHWSGMYAGDAKAKIDPVRDLRGHFAQLEADRILADRLARAEAEKARLAAEEKARQADLARQRRKTVQQLFEVWASVDLKPHIGTDGKRRGRKDGGEYTRLQFTRHVFPHIGSMAIQDVKKGDIMAVLDRQKAAGKLRTANVLLTDLKQMFGFALDREHVERNPLDTIRKRAVGGKDVDRERNLSPEEIRLLADKLVHAGMSKRSELAVVVILATACRVGELMNARWEHVDLENRRWLIPAEHSKNQRQHVVHLSDLALSTFKQLEGLRERAVDGELLPWVFPNRAGHGPVCVKSFGKQLADRQRSSPDKRLSRRSGNTDSLSLPGGHWTAHDLRRTAATIMASIGVSSDVIDECLNHMIQGRVTRIYIRDRREADQARAFDALGAKLVELTTDAPAPSNVTPLRSAA